MDTEFYFALATIDGQFTEVVASILGFLGVPCDLMVSSSIDLGFQVSMKGESSRAAKEEERQQHQAHRPAGGDHQRAGAHPVAAQYFAP